MNARTVGFDLSDEDRVHIQLKRTLRSSGGSPDGVLGLLGQVVRRRSWEHVDPPFESLEAFIADREHGLGVTKDDLLKLLDVKTHLERGGGDSDRAREYAETRWLVKRQLGEDIPEANEVGRPTKENSGATRITQAENSADSVLSRLKRDDPDMAEQVIRGDLTANAAAREKGWRKPRVLLTNPESVAVSIRKHWTPEQVAELAELLQDS